MDESPTTKFVLKRSVQMNEEFVNVQSCEECWYLCVQEPLLTSEATMIRVGIYTYTLKKFN